MVALYSPLPLFIFSAEWTDSQLELRGHYRGNSGRHFGVSADHGNVLLGGLGNMMLVHPGWSKNPIPWP